MKGSGGSRFALLTFGSLLFFSLTNCSFPSAKLELHQNARVSATGIQNLNRVDGIGERSRTVTVSRVPLVLEDGRMLVVEISDNGYNRQSADCLAVLGEIANSQSPVLFNVALVGTRASNMFQSIVGISFPENKGIPGSNLCNIPTQFFNDLAAQQSQGD